MALVDMVCVPYERSFTVDEMYTLVLGVETMVMEDKWTIQYHEEDSHVSFAKSWTDQLWCVLPMDTDTRTCAEPFVDSD